MDTIANRLGLALQAKNGGNQSELARFVGVSPQAVQKWLAGVTEPRGENLMRAAEFVGMTPSALKFGAKNDAMEGQTQALPKAKSLSHDTASEVDDAPDFIGMPKQLPVVGQVQAGADGLLHIDDYPVGYGAGTVPYWTKCPEAYALRIRGESMSPRYLPGEFVAVDPCTDVLPNNEVIVILKDERRMIKRLLWQNNDQICFESINKNYQNIICEWSEIDRLHKVLGGVPAEAFKKNY